MLPRGIRNNNPGNIDRNHISWQGMSTLQDDPRFIRFESPEYGLRTIMKILQTYEDKYDLFNIRKIIYRWAPPEENNTESYVSAVADHVGVGADDHIDVHDKNILMKLCQSIVIHENGNPPDNVPKFWYSDDTYQAALALI